MPFAGLFEHLCYAEKDGEEKETRGEKARVLPHAGRAFAHSRTKHLLPPSRRECAKGAAVPPARQTWTWVPAPWAWCGFLHTHKDAPQKGACGAGHPPRTHNADPKQEEHFGGRHMERIRARMRYA